MNAKRCKSIRRFLRASGIDPRQRSYVGVPHTRRRPAVKEQVGFDMHGKPRFRLHSVSTVTLAVAPNTGRGAYRRLKNEARRFF